MEVVMLEESKWDVLYDPKKQSLFFSMIGYCKKEM